MKRVKGHEYGYLSMNGIVIISVYECLFYIVFTNPQEIVWH